MCEMNSLLSGNLAVILSAESAVFGADAHLPRISVTRHHNRIAPECLHCFSRTQACYYNEVTSGVLPYIAGNLAGWSKSMEETALSCIAFLEKDNITTAL